MLWGRRGFSGFPSRNKFQNIPEFNCIFETELPYHYEGSHYEAAKNWVGENFLNVDNISWACDDKDPAKAILDCFEWESASLIKVGVTK